MNLIAPWARFGLTLKYKRLADLYVEKLISLGVNLDGDPAIAIRDFFDLGYSQGWLEKMRFMYLPVWGTSNVSANAVNMTDPYGLPAIFGAVDFTNSQAKSAGGVLNTRFNAGLMSSNNCGCAFYLTEISSGLGVDMGARVGPSDFALYSYEGAAAGYYQGKAGTGTAATPVSAAEVVGFTVFNSTPSGQRITRTVPRSPTITTLGTATAASGPMPNAIMYALGMNADGVALYMPTNRAYCFFAAWDGITNAQADQFSLAVNDLEVALRS